MPSVLLPNRVLGLSVRGGGGGFPWANLPGGNALHAWDFLNNTARWNGASVGALSNTPGWSFARASAGYAQTAAGVLTHFASGELRRTDKGVLIEGARTNKCTNYNAVLPALVTPAAPATFNAAVTNMTGSGPSGVLFGVVDDTAEIAAAGLSAAVTNGRVIKVDNSAGATEAFLTFGGTTGNTNSHTYSLYLRGSGLVRYGDNVGFGGTFAAPAGYTRYSKTQAAGGVSSVLGVGVAAGAVAYVILNQLEEASFVSSPIVVAGASATRAADVLTVPVSGLDYPLTLYAEFERAVDTGGVEVFLSVDATSAEVTEIRVGNTDVATFIPRTSSVAQASISIAGSIAVGSVTKTAGRVATNDIQFAKNGTLGTQDTTATNPTAPTRINFGAWAGVVSDWSYGYLRRAAIWNRALTDAELTAVTGG